MPDKGGVILLRKSIFLFAINFLVSFIGYISINYIGYFTNRINYYIFANPPTPVYILIIYWISTIIAPIILYFILGKKLNLLNNSGLDYLSVCGSLIFVFIVLNLKLPYETIIESETLSFILHFPYAWMGVLIISSTFGNEVGASFFVAVFPSIFIWLGMVRKRRRQIKNSEDGSKNSS